MPEPKQKRPAKPLNTAAGQRALAHKKGLSLRRFGKTGIPLAMGPGDRTEDGYLKRKPQAATRAYEAGPKTSKAGTKKAVVKAKASFAAGQKAKAAFNKKAYQADRPSELNAAKRSTVKVKPAGAPVRPTAKTGSKNPLGQIGEALDKMIPTRRWSHPVVPKPRREVNVPTIVNKALGK